MLDFIVLGLIPGTQKQVTFYDLLLFVLCTAVLYLSAQIVRRMFGRKYHRYVQERQQHFMIISL